MFQFFQLLIVACGSGSQELVSINLHVKVMTSILIYVRCVKMWQKNKNKNKKKFQSRSVYRSHLNAVRPNYLQV